MFFIDLFLPSCHNVYAYRSESSVNVHSLRGSSRLVRSYLLNFSVMSMKLYVGNISWNTSSDSLKEYFEQFGIVEDAFIMIDKVTRRSKGFGFVTFTNEEDALKAIEATNGKELDGRALTVNEARPPKNDNF